MARVVDKMNHCRLYSVDGATASPHRLLVSVLFGPAEIETAKCHCYCRYKGEKTSLVCMN